MPIGGNFQGKPRPLPFSEDGCSWWLQVCDGDDILGVTQVSLDTQERVVEDYPPDSQLLGKVRGSDVEAFRVLFERYQPILFRKILFETRQTDLSHDIVQETFLRVWTRRSSIKPDLSFLAYLLRISQNLVRDAYRHRKTREKLESKVPTPSPSAGDDPGEAVQLAMLQEKLIAIVNESLPDRCRAIFLLSRFEGKNNREIAALLDVSVKTVENQINHALKVMRKKLRDYL